MTAHPFQCAGAWAAAALSGRQHPSEVGTGDLDESVERIAADAEMAALAENGGPGWAWQQKLAAMFPLSPPTYPKRRKLGHPVRDLVRDLFAPDAPDARAFCNSCGRPANVTWGKQFWPLRGADKYLNEHGGRRWPTCRECRIAVWCLPYSSGYRSGYIHNLHLTSETMERDWARYQVAVSLTALRQSWPDWRQPFGVEMKPLPEPLEAALNTLDGDRSTGVSLTVLRWSNGNQEQVLKSYALSRADTTWLTVARSRGYAWHLNALAEYSSSHPLELATEAGAKWFARQAQEFINDRSYLDFSTYLTACQGFAALIDAKVRARSSVTSCQDALPHRTAIIAPEAALRLGMPLRDVRTALRGVPVHGQLWGEPGYPLNRLKLHDPKAPADTRSADPIDRHPGPYGGPVVNLHD
ncbi:hypothetical protein SAZ11_08755 [Streptomyces sp. FXJ1.4098]|nr:hypothetical protein [Streptomyces sp. FXJ1.4098]